MNYSTLDVSLQALFQAILPVSRAQSQRVSRFCAALLLAGRVPLSSIARWLASDSQQASRIRWLERLLVAPFVRAELVYQPALRQALATYRAPLWHLAIDRTTLADGQTDLVSVVITWRKRAIPLVWDFVDFGGAPKARYIALVRQAAALLPPDVRVVLHGDTEFGSVDMIRALYDLEWDFILGQPANVHVQLPGEDRSRPFASLPVRRRETLLLHGVQLNAKARLGGLNVLAFYQPKHHGDTRRKRTYCYLVTSLPLTPSVRRLGRRRWAVEPFHRDLKSAGFQLPVSQVRHPARRAGLFVLVALTYLLSVCFGGWVCKTGRRRTLDAKPRRHYSLFRLGLDWLIHQFRSAQPIPPQLRLYS